MCPLRYISLLAFLGVPFFLFGQPMNGDSISLGNPKLKWSGSIQVNGGIFRSTRNPGRMPDGYYRISGNPRLRYGNWDIPIAFQFGNFEDRLLQPFNKLGISPSYKWITIHAGYRQLDFSPFIYRNHLILGGGLELNPGKLRFATLYGELKRATAGGILSIQERYSNPAFQRTGITSRIGVGTDENFVDLVFLKAKDQNNNSNAETDSLKIYPEENLVFGLNTEQRIAEKWYFKATGTFSSYTHDTRSSKSTSDNFFVSSLVYDIFQPLVSTEYSAAFKGGLEYRDKSWRAKGKYEYVQPGYASMGVYSVQSDLQRFALDLQGFLFERRLTAQVGWRRENNNLLSTLNYTTTRNFLNTLLMWNQKRKWIGTAGLSYFGTGQSEGIPDLGGTGFDQATLQANLGYNRRRPDGSSHWSANINGMQRRNRVGSTVAFSSYNFRGDYIFILSNNKFWELRPGMQITVFRILETFTSTRLSPELQLAYKKSKSDFKAQVSLSPNFQFNTNTNTVFVWRTTGQASYRVKRKHFFALRINQSLRTDSNNYSEWQADLSYRFEI